MSTEVRDVPMGLAHIEFLTLDGRRMQRESAPLLQQHLADVEFIGTALGAIYEVATCHRECFGGSHLFETLCARVYNLGASAYILMVRGYYDEALNLIRGMGEIGNLISLLSTEPNGVEEWANSDRAARIKKFSPGKVRKRLKDINGLFVVDEDWYSRFCEISVASRPLSFPQGFTTRNR